MFRGLTPANMQSVMYPYFFPLLEFFQLDIFWKVVLLFKFLYTGRRILSCTHIKRVKKWFLKRIHKKALYPETFYIIVFNYNSPRCLIINESISLTYISFSFPSTRCKKYVVYLFSKHERASYDNIFSFQTALKSSEAVVKDSSAGKFIVVTLTANWI